MADNVINGSLAASGGFVGALTGNVTGNVTGNLTGNVTGDVTGNLSGYAGGLKSAQTLFGADGAITIKTGTALITKGSAAALTLAAPTAGTDDGKVLRIITTTAFAHTVTQTTPGFDNGGTASDVATFTAAIGNNLELEAYNGVWYVRSLRGVTLA